MSAYFVVCKHANTVLLQHPRKLIVDPNVDLSLARVRLTTHLLETAAPTQSAAEDEDTRRIFAQVSE